MRHVGYDDRMRPRWIGVSLALLLLIGITTLGYRHVRDTSLRSVTAGIVSTCEGRPGDRADCYEQIVPSLYPQYNVRQIAEVVREIQQSDPLYTYCHTLAHRIGERVVAEDPAQWVEAIHWDPPESLCEGGYLHGLLSARFSSEVLTDRELAETVPDFKRACSPANDWHPSLFEQMLCYHGLGHLYMYVTNDDVMRSVKLCDETQPPMLHKEGPRECYNAIFMQIFQARTPDQQELLKYLPFKPDLTNVREFCRQYGDEELEGICLSRSFPLHTELLQGRGLNTFCSAQPNALERKLCYARVYMEMTYRMLIDREAARPKCGYLESEHQEACYAMSAITILRQDNSTNAPVAIGFCTNTVPPAFRDSCMKALASESAYEFKKGSPEFNGYCARFTDAALNVCMNYEKSEYLDIGLGETVQ